MNDFNGYQQWAGSTDIGPGTDWQYTLGLVGETGEVAEKVKKAHRTPPLPVVPEEMAKELGDVLWYLARLASLYGYSLSQVAAMNVAKLEDRRQRGKLQGNGDKR